MTEDAIRNWNNAGADAEDDSQRVSMLLSAGDALAAALTSLARDLATARQERDRLERVIRACGLDPAMPIPGGFLTPDQHAAAVRAARAETWAHAAQVASDQGHYRLEKAFWDHASAAREGQ